MFFHIFRSIYHSIYSSISKETNIIFKYNGIVLLIEVNNMPVTFKRKVFKSGDSFRITIPMEIVRALDIKEKEELTIWLNDSQIIIEKV